MSVSHETARKIADELFAAETSIDAAMAHLGRLQAQVTAARAEGNLSAGFIQPTLEKISAASTALTMARGETCAAHDKLAAVQRAAGLGAVAFGPFEDKPATPAQLRAVEAAA